MYTWGYIKEASLIKLDLEQKEANTMGLIRRFHVYANEAMTQISSSVKPKHSFYEIEITDENVNKILSIDDVNFISFGDDVCTVEYYTPYGILQSEECHDDVLEYIGYNKFVCKIKGKYRISYYSRWFTFTSSTDESLSLPIPTDILECLPSYIAHQCYKIDDEYKSSVYRNEYEMFVSRINDVDYNNTTTFKIKGDW